MPYKNVCYKCNKSVFSELLALRGGWGNPHDYAMSCEYHLKSLKHHSIHAALNQIDMRISIGL